MTFLSACPEQRRAMRDLQRHLSGAGDGKLREIVALVDALPQRGAADGLIAPLRSRLTQLRPPRRVNLTRLIFAPADRVIVAPAQWRRMALAIPRSALPCLAMLIERHLGAEAAAMAEAVSGTMSDDEERILRHGRLVWPRAAAILECAPMPPEWPDMTGLGLPEFEAVARPLAVLLGEAVAIEQMKRVGDGAEQLGPPLRACLTRALERVTRMVPAGDANLAGLCLGMLLAVLLTVLPAAEALLLATSDHAARSGDLAARLAADRAVDAMLDQAEAQLAQPSGAIGTGDLTRIAALLDALEQPGPAGRPSRRSRALGLRRALDVHCRQRFQSDLADRLLSQLPQLGGATPDEMVDELEATALDLRRLEAVGRSFGGSAHYERALAEGGQALLKLARPDARRVDLARLAEILQGPEAGLAVLDAASR